MKRTNNQHVGTMDAATFARFNASADARERMDSEIRRQFKVPEARYFTVTTTKGHEGRVFVDHSRTRTVHSVKLSKSAA